MRLPDAGGNPLHEQWILEAAAMRAKGYSGDKILDVLCYVYRYRTREEIKGVICV